MKFIGTLVITDPCYLKNYYGPCIKRNTIYGDWSCMVYSGKLEENLKYKEWDGYYSKFFHDYNFTTENDEEKKTLAKTFDDFKKSWLETETLGEFCADAGEVGVFDYNLLNDENKLWIKTHNWCAAVIEDFNGDIDFFVDDNKNLHVIGTGNKPFFTVQSGL